MWTPKRVLILLAGVVFFTTSFGVYAYFLGEIDALPPLAPEYWPTARADIESKGPQEPEVDRKLQKAYGADCEEVRRTIKLDLRSKGWCLAADQFDIEPDGRVKLSPFSACVFPKGRPDARFPEINTVQCEIAYLTMDRPIASATELSNRKIVGVELQGSPKRVLTLINNRRTPEKNDDIELRITQGSIFFDERKDLVWTDGYVQLLDTQTQPHPTKITAKGLDLKLTRDPTPGRPGTTKTRGKTDTITGVDSLTLRSNVDMHLYVDARSGFLAGADTGKPEARRASGNKEPQEKSHIVIKTNGTFFYEVAKDWASFDSPVPNPSSLPSSPEQVLVSREHKQGDAKKYDQLLCDHLELQFREKKTAGRADPESKAMDREIESARATARNGKEVVLTMDTENLEAYGLELMYFGPTATVGPKTQLKGQPLHAVKDGHKIEALELLLIAPDKAGNGQQAIATGPGHIDLFDKSNTERPYPLHAAWTKTLVSTKEKDGDRKLDLLTFTGDALFLDTQNKQELRGQKIQVWLEPGPAGQEKKGSQASTASPRQRPHKVECFERVSAIAEEVIVKQAHHLVVRFQNDLPKDDRLPDTLPAPAALPGTTVAAPLAPGSETPLATANLPATMTPAKAETRPKKTRKPIELSANEIVIYVSRAGTKNQLQELVTEGAVHVHQDGENPKDKGVDIQGEMLNLLHHLEGDILHVFGDARKPGQLQLGELILVGPKVVINQRDNTAEVEGTGAMNLPSNTTFEGGKPTKEGTRLTIHWNKDMLFNGRYADFHGGVVAYQDEASLKCQELQVTLDRNVSFKEGQKTGQTAKVEKLVCDKKVLIVEDKRDAQGALIAYHRLESALLTMDNQEGPITAAGPGKMIHLAFGSTDNAFGPPGSNEPTPREGKKELMLTRIDFEGRLFSNSKDNTRISKFYDNVEVHHLPGDNPDAPVDPDKPGKNGFYLRCDLLTVYSRKEADHKTSQIMRAERRGFFRSQEFFGRAEMIKYDESQEQVIFEGVPGNPAVLYRVRQGMEPEELRASKILYNRRTGVFQLDGGKVIQSR